MGKQPENYIGSQQHWEDRINDDYYYQKQMEKEMEKDIEKQIYNNLQKRNKMILTPNEKAEELVRKYYSFGLNNPAQSFSWYECKQCAVIAVDELLNQLSPLDISPLGTYTNPKIEYWLEVKQEIEKL